MRQYVTSTLLQSVLKVLGLKAVQEREWGWEENLTKYIDLGFFCLSAFAGLRSQPIPKQKKKKTDSATISLLARLIIE